MAVRPFWRTLERIPGLTGPALEWRDSLNAEWHWAKALLKPTGGLAELVWTGSSLKRVVVHAPDRIVVVPDGGGPAQPIGRADVEILRLDGDRFAGWLCNGLGLTRGPGQLASDGTFAHLGRFHATRGTACPVHLCMQDDEHARSGAIRRLLGEAREPIVVLTPDAVPELDVLQLLRIQSGCHMRLADAVDLDDSGRITKSAQAALRLRDLARTVEHWETGEQPGDPFLFARVDEGVWQLTFNRESGLAVHKEARALSHIQHLLARPHQEIWVERLEQLVTGNRALDAVFSGDAVVDRDGLAVIWQELQGLKAERAAAHRDGDAAAEQRLGDEIDRLRAHVRATQGLNDRVRPLGSELEKLRTRVTQAVRRAYVVVGRAIPSLEAHLRTSINLGTSMSYTPDAPIPWVFGQPVTRRVTA